MPDRFFKAEAIEVNDVVIGGRFVEIMPVDFSIRASATHIPIADETVQCVVTSPPYWGLRKYAGEQELIWGGEPECEHDFCGETISDVREEAQHGKSRTTERFYGDQSRRFNGNHQKHFQTHTCRLCGAWRGGYGLEPTVEMYVEHSVEILREVRRVLRKDGVCFWNVGDSYAATRSYQVTDSKHVDVGNNHGSKVPEGLKPKDLCLIPFRVALAAQAPQISWLVPREGWRGWLAGIIDGEGCIGIHHYERNDGPFRYHQFQPYISVTMSDVQALEHCKTLTGAGSVRLHTAAGRDSRGIRTRRDTFVWRVEGDAVAPILGDIYPWLIVKRPQAKMAFALWDGKYDHPHTRQGRFVPDAEVQRRLSLWERIKSANQRQEMNADDLDDIPVRTDTGWWVRSVIVWAKPNPMPESVTDRPTDAYEHILMLTKSAAYFWDADAVREPQTGNAHARGSEACNKAYQEARDSYRGFKSPQVQIPGGRNLRNVWMFPTQSYPEAHFATFPEELPRRCIKAATSEKGACVQCGAPWKRVVKASAAYAEKLATTSEHWFQRQTNTFERGKQDNTYHGISPEYLTVGWRPSCRCRGQHGKTRPCIVLDPFGGSGTTAKVALELNRTPVLLDLAYHELQRKRTRNIQLGLVYA